MRGRLFIIPFLSTTVDVSRTGILVADRFRRREEVLNRDADIKSGRDKPVTVA